MPGKLTITVGIPGSGKTTVAQEMLALGNCDEIISRDDLRAALFNGEGILTPKQETRITHLETSIVKDALREGKHIVVHDTNLKEAYRKKWGQLAYNLGAAFDIIDLTQVDVDDCFYRDYDRGNSGGRAVGETVIRDLHKRFVEGKGPVEYPVGMSWMEIKAHPYIPHKTLPKTILVDIDGTVADCTGVRSPYDSSRYHLDKPKTQVIDLVRELHYDLGYQIVFCSGRHGRHRDVTEEWLFEHVKVPFHLVMREHDGRDDSVEKLWLFDQYIRNYYNVKFVLDDRDRVVKMWRKIGLLTLQVDEGDF